MPSLTVESEAVQLSDSGASVDHPYLRLSCPFTPADPTTQTRVNVRITAVPSQDEAFPADLRPSDLLPRRAVGPWTPSA